jgi:hypothetical protein
VAPCLLILLRQSSCDGLPAAVRLSKAKGASNPAERIGENLRDALGSPSKILALIHSPDEPIDLLRELALLGSKNPHLNIQHGHDIAKRPAQQFVDIALGWQESIAPCAFDQKKTLNRLEEGFKVADCDHPLGEISLISASLRAGKKVEWMGTRKVLRGAGLGLDTWDELVIGGLFADTGTAERRT